MYYRTLQGKVVSLPKILSMSSEQIQNKIFIVDDSPVVVARLSQLINEIDEVVVVGYACSISAALLSIQQVKPDAVILDIHLKEDAPDANGIDLLIMLRKSYPDLLIIMLTNVNVPQYIERCMESGADYFFDKSNDFDKIPETLKGIYSHKHPNSNSIILQTEL